VSQRRSFTPSQLRQLRSGMEQDFARALRSIAPEHMNGASSSSGASTRQVRSESDEMDAVLHERAQARLAAVAAALRRLDMGDYGNCARCGARIPFGRLAVMPEATLCMACGGT
jgi:DnaK suppressor protein